MNIIYVANRPLFSNIILPSEITTAFWGDASDASTVITSGGFLSQWNDKSGNARHATQAVGSSQPAYTLNGQNNLNCLTLDGSNDWLALPNSVAPTGPHAVFAVCRPNHSSLSSGIIISRSYNWGSFYLNSATFGTSAFHNIGVNGVSEAKATVTGLQNNTLKMFTAIYDNTAVRLSVNKGPFISTPYTPNLTYHANDQATIGALREGTANVSALFRGAMCELIVTHYVPTSEVITGIQNHLDRWFPT
jgi:hypothetical protein